MRFDSLQTRPHGLARRATQTTALSARTRGVEAPIPPDNAMPPRPPPLGSTFCHQQQKADHVAAASRRGRPVQKFRGERMAVSGACGSAWVSGISMAPPGHARATCITCCPPEPCSEGQRTKNQFGKKMMEREWERATCAHRRGRWSVEIIRIYIGAFEHGSSRASGPTSEAVRSRMAATPARAARCATKSNHALVVSPGGTEIWKGPTFVPQKGPSWLKNAPFQTYWAASKKCGAP